MYNKEYYAKNKDNHREKYGKPRTCSSCNCVVSQWNWSRHIKSKKHLVASEHPKDKLQKLENKLLELQKEIDSLKAK